jgi:PAS domain S-box-containing protein
MVDAAGRIVKANPEAERLFGYPAASLLGKPVECLIPAPYRPRHEQHRRDFAANPLPRSMGQDRELFAETNAGVTFPVEVSLAPITIKDRSYVVATVVDISARKHAEAMLRTSQSQLRTFVEHAPISVAMLDRDFRYLVTSKRWVEEYGRGQRELIGKLHYEIHPDIPEDWKRAHRDALAGAFLKNDEDLWVQADGSPHWLRWAVYPWHDDQGEVGGIIISAENVTARKLAEDQVRKLNAGLERRVAERTADLEAANRELDAFAYAVSHDLRGPLRAMSGFSSALEEDYGEQLPAGARNYLAQIKQSSHRMGELIDGILTLSRSARGELLQETVDLSEIAQRIRAELEQGDPQHQAAWEIQAGMVVRGDGRMLEAVIRNLLGNAWKYSSRSPTPQIRFYAENSGAWRRYCVADNGAGFDMAYAHGLFKPFQRLHRQDEFPGIGVGLATVRRIIQRHGGEIHAQGALGQGATFCFTLPQTDAGAETA